MNRAIEQGKLTDLEAHFTDAKIKQKIGSLEEVKAIYDKIIKLDPNNVQAHNNLGIAHLEASNLIEAEKCFRQAIALKANFAPAHFYLGRTLGKLSRLSEAEESFRCAISLKLGFVEAYRNLASILRRQKKLEEALECERFTKFLKPSNFKELETKKTLGDLSIKQPKPMEHELLYRPGMGTENVGIFLKAMAQMLRPKNILEIGAGYTTAFLLDALISNEKVYDDGNLEPSYFHDYVYDPKLVVIDNMSLGELSKKPGMSDIISSEYIEFIEGRFEGRAQKLRSKYKDFDFVWFDCGGSAEYKSFLNEYWDICSGYVFFHFTYTDGQPNELHDVILKNLKGNTAIFDIVEPHKSRQGSITIVRKN